MVPKKTVSIPEKKEMESKLQVFGVTYQHGKAFDQAKGTGDFEKMVGDNCLIVFNDNFEDRKAAYAGSGNACMRPYVSRGWACGVPTGWKPGVPFRALGKAERLAIDLSFDRLIHCIQQHSHHRIFYSVDYPHSGLLGTSTFRIGSDVGLYITQRLLSLHASETLTAARSQQRVGELENMLAMHVPAAPPFAATTPHQPRQQNLPSSSQSLQWASPGSRSDPQLLTARPDSAHPPAVQHLGRAPPLLPHLSRHPQQRPSHPPEPRLFQHSSSQTTTFSSSYAAPTSISRFFSDRATMQPRCGASSTSTTTSASTIAATSHPPNMASAVLASNSKKRKRMPPDNRDAIDWRVMGMAPQLMDMMPSHVRLARERYERALVPKTREQLLYRYGTASIPTTGKLPRREDKDALGIFNDDDFDAAGDLLPDEDVGLLSEWTCKLELWRQKE